MTSFWFVLAAVLMSVLPAHGADRTIYLTFDEGPLSGTGNILDVLQASHLVSEIDHLFGYGHFARPGKLILLMHDEMFQDRFDGKTKLTELIAALKLRQCLWNDPDL